MSKGLRNYDNPKLVVDRRLRQGGNGLGTLAARDYQDRMEFRRINSKVKRGQKLKEGELAKAVEIHERGVFDNEEYDDGQNV